MIYRFVIRIFVVPCLAINYMRYILKVILDFANIKVFILYYILYYILYFVFDFYIIDAALKTFFININI